MEKKTRFSTLRLCELALLVALELLMALTPLGYLQLPFISASLISIPVAIGAILMGPLESTLLGLVFGLTSFVKGFTTTSLMTQAMYAASIPMSFVVAVIGRVLMGLCVGLLVQLVRKLTRNKDGIVSCIVGGIGAPMLNTFFYMGLLMLLFYRIDYIQNFAAKVGSLNPIVLIAAMVGTQALIEIGVCGFISTVIGKTLLTVLNRKKK